MIVFDCCWLNAKHTTVQLNLKHCRHKDIGCGCLDPMLWSLLEGRCKTICGTLTVDVNTLQDAFTIALKNPVGGTFLGDLCTFYALFMHFPLFVYIGLLYFWFTFACRFWTPTGAPLRIFASHRLTDLHVLLRYSLSRRLIRLADSPKTPS